MKYTTVIGLEVHAQLKTNSKIFCGCENVFGAKPNTKICPVCLGLPGALPVLNQKVVEYAVKAGYALSCEIATISKMDRKNYFYPDLCKAYQISQFDQPICEHGHLMIEFEGQEKRLGITRIHIEEDAGKLIHVDGSDYSLVDYNRGGVPLIEIVSEPDMRTPDEAFAYLTNMKAILEYIEVSDCNMEEGSLRCDANISIMPEGITKFGTKAEIKNMNSFRGVHKAITYEVERQKKLIESGVKVLQETRLWDASQEKTFSMRSKENAHDYRYFPEPDLPTIYLKDEAYLKEIKEGLPELPQQRKKRFIQEYQIPSYDAGVLTAQKALANYYEDTVQLLNDPKMVSNWVMTELLKELKTNHLDVTESKVSPEEMVNLIQLVKDDVISHQNAKVIFNVMFNEGKKAKDIIEEKGLQQMSDSSEIEDMLKEIISENSKSVDDYKSGNKKARGFFVGQVMYRTQGKANPKLVNEIISKLLS
jgi:aspartyl-tRNA(Asn)/glutamyl-tRNA(Gln) amidotransferase subunit B